MQKTLLDYWWLVMIRGLVGILIGLVAIVYPQKTLVVVTLLFGLFLLIDGAILSIASLFSIKSDKKWWLGLLQGAVGLLIGLAIFSYPQITVALFVFLVGLWLIIIGILAVVNAILMRKSYYGGWLTAAAGIIAFLFGMVMLSHPAASVTAVAILVGIYMLLSGIFVTALGMEMRSGKKDLEKLSA